MGLKLLGMGLQTFVEMDSPLEVEPQVGAEEAQSNLLPNLVLS